MRKVRLRLIGDVHGHIDRYLKAIEGSDYSIALGDIGFADSYQRIEKSGLSLHHRFIKGNHDAIDVKCDYDLGDFGVYTVPDFGDVFFIRGAWSIDWKPRVEYERKTGYKSWWENEELSYAQLEEALRMYRRVKPDMVVSHDCPQSIRLELIDQSILRQFGYDKEPINRTVLCLQAMFDEWQPQSWLFGHHHKRFNAIRNGTHFIGLNELEVYDFHKKIVPHPVKGVRRCLTS